MRKPFYQIFISHLTGTFTGMLVLAGFYDTIDSSFLLYNVQLALMASVFALISLAVNRFFYGVKSARVSSSAIRQKLIRRLFAVLTLLSFWIPTIQNASGCTDADKRSDRFSIITDSTGQY